MFSIFKRNQGQAQPLQGEDLQQFLDGFATGYPLQGQPDYPNHGKTRQYKRGLNIGKHLYQKDGRPQIPYDGEGE